MRCLLTFGVLVLSGCRGKSIEGSWDLTAPELTGVETFNPDKSFTSVMDLHGIKVAQTGVWSSKDSLLRLKEFSRKAEGGDPGVRAALNMPQSNKVMDNVCVWRSKDEVEVTTSSGFTMTLRRRS